MPYLLHVAAIQFNTAPVPHLLWRTQTAIANVRSNLLSSRMVFILLNECAYIFPSSNMLFSAFFFFFSPYQTQMTRVLKGTGDEREAVL